MRLNQHKGNTSSLLGVSLLILQVGMFPILALWNQNLGQITPQIIAKPLLFTLGFTCLIGLFWLLITKFSAKAALFACVTFIVCFTYGHAFDLLSKIPLFTKNVGFIKFFALYVILFIGLMLLIVKIKPVNQNTILFLNLGTAALLLINLIPILIYTLKTAKPAVHAETAENTPSAYQEGQRDIYYIVLDAYARDDVLQNLLGVDNSVFLSELKERGFYLPACALSNYDITEATVGSVLNLDYLQNLGVPTADIGEDTAENALLIWNNQVREYFKERGYLFVTTRGFASFNDIQDSDLYLNYTLDQEETQDVSEQRFLNMYLNTTVFRVVSELYKNNPEKLSSLPDFLNFNLDENAELSYANYWYNQNNYVFDKLEEIPHMSGDYLVYAHVNSPHAPYVFRSDGSLNYPLESTDEKTSYSNTITYLNKRVLELIDTLQENSDPQPIIILQADHGIHMLTGGLDKHKILSAYYLPDDVISPAYDTLTPVNNFRLVIKNYFDPNFELLPDMIYVKFLNEYEFIPASCNIEP